MKEKIAEIKNLRLDYGSVCAIRDVSFDLFSGEILAVIGPNGAGKTSSVECLEGLRRPSGGSVTLFGCNPCTDRRRLYQKVGIQLQSAEYPDRIKVKEVCRLFASFYENPADWKRLLEQFDLDGKAGRLVRSLSGGERQRLSVLLALLPRPKLLVLDELTTGLDPEVRRGIWESLKQIRSTGVSILLVSHYLDEVEYLSDRILYIDGGRSVFEGTPAAFRGYVKDKTGSATDTAPLEEVYLMLSPKTNTMNLEGLL